MKRKDIISVVAMCIIIIIAYLGALFTEGDSIGAVIILLIILLPLAFFYFFAVLARNRKGNYVKFWRAISYVSFAMAVIFFLINSVYFMHYFDVTSKVSKVSKGSEEDTFADKVEKILTDYESMYDDYETLVNSRVASYHSDLMTLYNQGQNNRIKELIDPTMTVTRASIDRVTDDWKVMMFKNHAANKKIMEESVKKYSVLFDNFKVFSAPVEINNLITQYTSHKKQLEDDFAKQTAIERMNGITPVFTFKNSENEWMDVKDIFTKLEFNFRYFIIYLVLVAFACSSYIFFKDTMVKAPKRTLSNQDIYSLGYKL